MRVLLMDGGSVMLPLFQAGLFGLGARVLLVSVGTLRMARHLLRDELPFDFVLLDLQPTSGTGFEALAEICTVHPSTPVLACSSSLSTTDIVRAIYLGASAFVPHAAGISGLLEALRSVADGRIYLPPLFMDRTASCAAADPFVPLRAAGARWRSGDLGSEMRPTASVASCGLTPRQSDVLDLLLQGRSNKVIARQLNLSVETIKDHVTRLLRRLNVNSRTQAVLAVSGMVRRSHSAPTAGLRSPMA